MPSKSLKQLAALRIPYLDSAIEATAGEELPIWAEGDGGNTYYSTFVPLFR